MNADAGGLERIAVDSAWGHEPCGGEKHSTLGMLPAGDRAFPAPAGHFVELSLEIRRAGF
jgi:hypothetical protein